MNYSKVLNIVLALALIIIIIMPATNNKEDKNETKIEEKIIDYSKEQKVAIGKTFNFMPTPTVIAGTEVNGKVNWITLSNVGYWGQKYIFAGSRKIHHSNIGIREHKTLSINFVSESILPKADYVGMKSGAKVDKSGVFEIFRGELKAAPMIKESPISLECKVIDSVNVGLYDYFILEIVNTYASKSIVNAKSKIDFTKFSPILFEMNNFGYIKTGKVVGKGFQEASKYNSN